jgi:hypothetical protein
MGERATAEAGAAASESAVAPAEIRMQLAGSQSTPVAVGGGGEGGAAVHVLHTGTLTNNSTPAARCSRQRSDCAHIRN